MYMYVQCIWDIVAELVVHRIIHVHLDVQYMYMHFIYRVLDQDNPQIVLYQESISATRQQIWAPLQRIWAPAYTNHSLTQCAGNWFFNACIAFTVTNPSQCPIPCFAHDIYWAVQLRLYSTSYCTGCWVCGHIGYVGVFKCNMTSKSSWLKTNRR